MRAGVGHQAAAAGNGRPYSSKRNTRAGRWRSQFCKLVQHEKWRPSRRPAEAENQGDDRGRQLGRDVFTFEDMREFVVAYSKYEQ